MRLSAPTAVGRLMAPGGCLQPGQRGSTEVGAAGRPAAPSPAPTQGIPTGWDPSCRQMRTGARADSAPVQMRQHRCSGTAPGAEWEQGPVPGGTAPILQPQRASLARSFPPSPVGLAQRDGDPAVSSLQGTSSTAWHPLAMTPIRSRVCHHRHQTQPTYLAMRSTATPRAPSPAFLPATSTGRRQ